MQVEKNSKQYGKPAPRKGAEISTRFGVSPAQDQIECEDGHGQDADLVHLRRDAARDESLARGGAEHFRADGHHFRRVKKKATLPKRIGSQHNKAPAQNEHRKAPPPRV